MCDPKRLLTPKDAAELLQINTEVLRRWLREGKLPGVKVGADWRVRESDLEHWLRPEDPPPAPVIDDGPKMCVKFPKWLEYSGLPRQLNDAHGPEAWPVFRTLIEMDFDRQGIEDRSFAINTEDIATRTGYTETTISAMLTRLRDAEMISCREKSGSSVTVSIRTPLATPKLVLDIDFCHGGVRGAPDKAFDKACVRRYLESDS